MLFFRRRNHGNGSALYILDSRAVWERVNARCSVRTQVPHHSYGQICTANCLQAQRRLFERRWLSRAVHVDLVAVDGKDDFIGRVAHEDEFVSEWIPIHVDFVSNLGKRRTIDFEFGVVGRCHNLGDSRACTLNILLMPQMKMLRRYISERESLR